MATKRYKAPDLWHGKAPGILMAYFNATGEVNISETLLVKGNGSTTSTALPLSPIKEPILTDTIATAQPVRPLRDPIAPTSPISPIKPVEPIKDPITNFTPKPVLTSPIKPGPTIVIPVVTAPTGEAPKSGGGFGGGGGGGIMESDQKSGTLPQKKKSNFFPWLLIATGIYMIVKQPLK